MSKPVALGVTWLVTGTLCQRHHKDDGLGFAPKSKGKQSCVAWCSFLPAALAGLGFEMLGLTFWDRDST